jgi:Ca2+-binding RTX toxin-like protein
MATVIFTGSSASLQGTSLAGIQGLNSTGGGGISLAGAGVTSANLTNGQSGAALLTGTAIGTQVSDTLFDLDWLVVTGWGAANATIPLLNIYGPIGRVPAPPLGAFSSPAMEAALNALMDNLFLGGDTMVISGTISSIFGDYQTVPVGGSIVLGSDRISFNGGATAVGASIAIWGDAQTANAGAGQTIYAGSDHISTIGLLGVDPNFAIYGDFQTLGGSVVFGNDTIVTGGGNDTVYGDAPGAGVAGGNDFISTDGGSDQLFGGGGDDTLWGGNQADTLEGGDGHDNLEGGTGADILNGGAGWDAARYDSAFAVDARLYNSALNTGAAAGDTYISIEQLVGGSGNDTLYGDGANNIIAGLNGNDLMDGVGGAVDQFFGGDGLDQVFCRSGADIIDGGNGVDYARYDYAVSAVRAYLYDASQNLGDATGDIYTSVEALVGSGFADDLRGDSNANALSGGGGNDFLVGLSGADQMDGGAGLDTFYYTSPFDGGTGDGITDFVSGNDRIMLDGSQFGLGSPGGVALDAFRFVAGLNATLATIQFGYDAASREVWYDFNGTGAGGRTTLAYLQVGATLVNTDILVL